MDERLDNVFDQVEGGLETKFEKARELKKLTQTQSLDLASISSPVIVTTYKISDIRPWIPSDGIRVSR